jgi:hypothetical protein
MGPADKKGNWTYRYCSAATAAREAQARGEMTDGGGACGFIFEGDDVVAYLPHHRDPKEDEARLDNAKLLSSAKDMLKALRTLVEMGERPLGPHDYPGADDKQNIHGGRWAFRHEEMRAVAEAAVAKAIEGNRHGQPQIRLGKRRAV